MTIAALLLGSLGVLLTGCTTPSFLVSLPPLPPQDINELNQRAMEVVKKSPIRSNTVIGVHHIKLSEHKLFDEFFPLVSSDPATAPPVVFALSERTSVMVVTDRLRTTDIGLSWVGHIQNNPRSSVLFLADTKTRTISGEIRIDGKIYEIRPGESGSYAVFEIEPSRFPPEHSFEWHETPSGSHVPRSLFPSAETTGTMGIFRPVIDVMVLYTQEAIDADADPNHNIAKQICDAITQVKESFFDSGVTPLLRLVHHERIDFPESGNPETDARNLRDSTFEKSKSAHGNRSTYGADLVSLWIGDKVADKGDICGAAQAIIQPGESGSGGFAFSVVRRNCAIANLSFAHELGHLMGANHDRFGPGADTWPGHNYGYIRPDKNWKTIMAVDRVERMDCPLVSSTNPDGTVTTKHSCVRVKYWSNPARTYPPPPSAGDAMGCPNGTPTCGGPADNASTLNGNADAVSNFTPTATPITIRDLGYVSCNVINTGGDVTPPVAPANIRIQ